MFELRTDSLSSLSSFRTDNRRDDLLFFNWKFFVYFGESVILSKIALLKNDEDDHKKVDDAYFVKCMYQWSFGIFTYEPQGFWRDVCHLGRKKDS